MEQYISKSALVAEIDKRRESNAKEKFFGRLVEDNYFLDFLNTLKVKEVNLEHLEQEVKNFCYEYDDRKEKWYNMTPHDKNIMVNPTWANFAMSIAKHFFELGLSANNPITATDRGTAEEIIINLKRVEKDYRIDLTKEKKWVRNKIQKGE